MEKEIGGDVGDRGKEEEKDRVCNTCCLSTLPTEDSLYISAGRRMLRRE